LVLQTPQPFIAQAHCVVLRHLKHLGIALRARRDHLLQALGGGLSRIAHGIAVDEGSHRASGYRHQQPHLQQHPARKTQAHAELDLLAGLPAMCHSGAKLAPCTENLNGEDP